jgi:hypothetical protein
LPGAAQAIRTLCRPPEGEKLKITVRDHTPMRRNFPQHGGQYALGAVLMISGAVCERLIGVEAAGRSLE